jgi:hypothetical protein
MGPRAVLDACPKREVLPLIWNKTPVLLYTQSFYFEYHTNKHVQKHKLPCVQEVISRTWNWMDVTQHKELVYWGGDFILVEITCDWIWSHQNLRISTVTKWRVTYINVQKNSIIYAEQEISSLLYANISAANGCSRNTILLLGCINIRMKLCMLPSVDIVI